MPTSRKAARQSVGEALKSAPSTWIRPCCAGSRRLRQRINVDLPEPEVPHSTIRSPCTTRRSIPCSTWYGPYHLLSPSTSITTGAGAQIDRSNSPDDPLHPPFPIIRQLAACGG